MNIKDDLITRRMRLESFICDKNSPRYQRLKGVFLDQAGPALKPAEPGWDFLPIRVDQAKPSRLL